VDQSFTPQNCVVWKLLKRHQLLQLIDHAYCDMTPESQSSQLLDNGSLHVPLATNRRGIIQELFEVVVSIRFAPSYKRRTHRIPPPNPCGGGVEYLHRDSANRKRRRKRESRIWDSKICPRVLRDSDPNMTALARPSSNCKLQTRPLVKEGAPNQQTRNCQTIIKIWS
jgi:hypothetical protein